MSLLLAVKSCERDAQQGFHQAIRETWGTYANAPVNFFIGGERVLSVVSGDEVRLNCPDGYWELPHKTKAILQWFLGWTEHSHIFLMDCDTFVSPEFFQLNYQEYDYAGRFGFWPTGTKMGTTFAYNDGLGNTIDPCHAWASGGYGYFLSRKAAQLVVDSTPMSWAEDLWVGQVLGPHIIDGSVKGHDFEYDGRMVWHIHKGKNQPFTPQRIRDYFQGARV